MRSFISITGCYIQYLFIQIILIETLQKKKKKCSLVYQKKIKKIKSKKSKQFNLYGKLTKAKSNFDSNLIFSKLWF